MTRFLHAAQPGVTRSVAHPFDTLSLPFVVIKGRTAGRRVCITAGIHGSEYCAIEAAQRLLTISPSDVSGSLVILPLVNGQGFLERSVYKYPLDGKNLNRVFPGRADGSASERLAHWLIDEVLGHVDAYIDLHCGDLNEALSPFTLFREGDEKAQSLARVFGFPDAISSQASGMTISAASDAGVPAIIAEAGGNGQCDANAIDALVEGVMRVLNSLNVTVPAHNEPDGSPTRVNICKCASVIAEADGLWYPSCRAGSVIHEGDKIGQIRNSFGDDCCTIISPISGKVLFHMTSLAVNKGETVIGIGY